MHFSIRTICSAIFALIACQFLLCGISSAHEFEDGVVDRSASCIVRDHELIIEYSIGLNANTMDALTCKWIDERLQLAAEKQLKKAKRENAAVAKDAKVDEDDLHPAAPRSQKIDKAPVKPENEPGQLKPADAAPKKTNSAPPKPVANKVTPDAQPQQLESDTKTSGTLSTVSESSIAEPTGTESKNPESVGNSKKKEVAGPTPEQLQRFSDQVAIRIKSQLQVSSGDKRLSGEMVSVRQAGRHNVDLIVTLKFDLSGCESHENGTVPVEILDQVFDPSSGLVRYSFKAKGQAFLSKSNVAPVLVRSPRVDLSKLSPQETLEKTKVAVELGFSEKR